MSLKELQQIYYLRKEIDMWNKRLYELSEIKAVRYDGCGSHGSGISSPVVRLAEQRAKIRRIILEKENELMVKESEITEYIISVDDSFIRQILYKRHVELKSWTCIAAEIGNNTPDSVRMAHKRFLQKK